MKGKLTTNARVAVLIFLLLGIFTLAGVGTPSETANASTAQVDDLTIVRVYYPDLDMARKIFISFEAAILETNYEEGYYIMQVTPEELALLEAAGLRVEVDKEWSPPLQRQSALASFAGIPGYACYRTVEETLATAQSIADNYPDLASWVDIGDSWEKTAGLGGYDMQVLVLTNKSVSGPKPRLFVMSEIHAREYPTTELVLRFAEQLINNYGNDADATWLLDYHEIHLLLYTNPDARKKAETGLMWRKNTNQNYCGATSNDRGADLNRNFEYQWNCCGGSSSSQCVETYHGPSAASEPETQAIQNYLRAIFPDQRGPNPIDAAPLDATGVFLSIHGGTRLVIWPWAFTASSTSNGNQLQTLGRKFAYWNHYPAQQAIGLYVTDGSDEDFAYGDLGIAAYEFEISASFFQDCATFENTILPDNLPALMYAAKAARTPYMTPAGPDAYNLSISQDGAQAGTPVTFMAQVDDSRYAGSEAIQNITAAEYYLDVPPWQDGSTAYTMSALDGSFDTYAEDLQATVETSNLSPGRHIIFVRGQDADGNWGAFSAIFLDIADEPVQTLTLLSPTDGSITSSPTPTFTWWSNVAGAAEYQIQVDNNADFSSPEIDTTTTDSAYTPTSELASGIYSWHVRVNNGEWGEYSSAWTMTVAAPPAVPSLTSPADGSTTTDNTPTFDWDDVTGATQYQIQVDNNADFSSPMISTTTTASTYTPTAALPSVAYSWRVRASNGLWSAYSSAWTITVAVTPATPSLTSPANGSATADSTPTFDWGDVTGATQYQIQVDNNTDFSSPEIDAITTYSTYTPTSALALGPYSWRVRASNGMWGSYSSVRTMTIAVPPAAPSLASPADGSTNSDSTPTFDWSDTTGATQYQVQADNNADFSSPVISSTTTVSTYTPTSALLNNTYYWHVRVSNNGAWSDYSSAWTITVDALPAVPSLTLPANGAATADSTPTFDWGDVVGATQYQIQVDNNADFSSPEIDATTATSTYTPTSALAPGTYSWHVRASNGIWGSYSSTRTVTIAVPPSAPILASPADGSTVDDNTPTFDWNDVVGATQYQIEIHNTNNSSGTLTINTATSTYTPTTAMTNGVYSWRVRASNGVWSDYSSAWTVTVAATPSAPILASPADGSTVAAITPTFDWGDVTGAAQYQIQVDNNTDFSSPEIDTTTTTSAYAGITLANGAYSWRVRASNGVWSDYSSVWTVTINALPAAPILASPASASTTTDDTPTFDWGDVTGATQYQILVDNNSDFSSPEIDVATTTSTYTPTSALALGAHYWHVRASNGTWGSYSSTWIVTIAIPPAAPILASPADGSTVDDSTPTFDWGDVTGATQYQILVDDNTDFSSPAISTTTTTSTYTPTSTLVNGAYSWRVRASNGVWSDTSSVWTVTINALPAAPILASPANASVTVDITPTFSWSNVVGATQYQILVDNNSDFSSPEIDVTTTASTYTPTSRLALGASYWRVRASNGMWGSYSGAWKVTVVAPPVAPILVSPADGSSVDDSTPTFDWGSVTGATQYQIQVDNNADFSSPVFSVLSSVSIYTHGSALANGLYYWHVRASNGMWGEYSSASMVTVAVPPAAPTLASPIDGSTIADGTPGFDWGNVTRAVQYQIQVDNNTDFSSPEIDITGTPSTYTPTPFLPNGAYSWRVRAVDIQNNWGDWSASWSIAIADDNRLDVRLNNAWMFHLGDVTGAQEISFDDSGWTSLDLPHTWNNLDGQDGGDNYYRGIGWYRKHYAIPSDYAGKRVFIRFEAVSKVADVYVNGTLVGHHAGGFAAFAFDITNTISIGADNVIAVKADNSASLNIAPLSGDFNQDGGIYRPVHLLVTGKAHITPLDYGSPGVYLTPTNVSAGSADLQVAAKVDNTGDTQEMVTVRTTIKDADGTEVATLTSTQDMAASSSATFVQTTTLANPHLWNGRSDPYLYQAVVQVRLGDTIVDEVAQPLGFRTFQVDPDTGFTLNGNPLDLHGAGMHENREDKGRAISDADRAEDIGLIMDMGATFVRLAHYQHGETTYDLCDENGLVVWTEIPLVNYTGSSNTAFSDNIKQQLVELIRQNYNHPSVFFWSLYNAIQTTNVSLIAELNDLAHQEDATRLTTGATPTSFSPSASLPIDLVGWDMYRAWYGGSFEDGVSVITNAHTYHPYLGISEYGAGANISHHEENPLAPDPYGDWHPEEYQSIFHETYWKQMEAMPFLWVKSIFAAFDFASDSRAEGDRPGINDKGIITSDRSVKKDAFYWYKANWSDELVVYITSRRFTPRDNSLVEVKVYSNCDSIQLLVNDVSHGSKTSTDHIYRWTDVILAGGNNAVRAVCTIGAEQYEDSTTWDGGVALSPLPVGLHQETDSRIDYTGTWTSYVGSEPNGGSTNTTIQQNATVRFDFEGTELRLYRTTASDRGPMQICVDTVCQTVQNDSPTTQWNQMVSIATGLADGVHQASIRNLTTSTIDLDAVEVLIPPAAPSLLSPADGSTTVDPTPTFGWGDVTGATEYQIQVDDNSNFTSPEIDETLTSSAYIHTSALVNGTYYWHVRASNGTWSGYSGARMVTVAVPPAMPTLLTPANGSITTDNTPAFDWEDATGATQYQIQADNNTDFSSPVIDTIVTTSASTATFALVDRTYSWRVRAGDDAGLWSEYSEPWTVTVDTTPPPVPILASPANGAVTKDDTPDFDWGDITGATQYQIQVDNNSNFASPEVNATEVTISAYTPTSELNDGTYYWRVRAGDGVNLWSAYSAARRVVIDTTAPTFPGLLTPANNASVRGTPTYTWGAVSTAMRYEFQYDDEDTFSEPFYTSGELAVRSRKPPAQTPGAYYWRVKARDAAGNWGAWSAVRTITILPVIPAVPVLESPLNAAQTRDTTPTLQWKASAGGNSYQVQFDNTSTCASPEQGATGSELRFTAAEISPGTYYWRVRAINVNGEMGAWSAIWRVAIDTTGPAAPALSTPANNASVRGTPTYVWLAAATAVRYEFQYDNNADFSSPEYTSIELAGTSHKPPAQTPDVYYWRVRARDTAGNWSEWSPPRRILIY